VSYAPWAESRPDLMRAAPKRFFPRPGLRSWPWSAAWGNTLARPLSPPTHPDPADKTWPSLRLAPGSPRSTPSHHRPLPSRPCPPTPIPCCSGRSANSHWPGRSGSQRVSFRYAADSPGNLVHRPAPRPGRWRQRFSGPRPLEARCRWPRESGWNARRSPSRRSCWC